MEKRFDFCAIINARSGGCGEDCKWCAQSGRWRTGCERHGWVGTEACVRAAKEAAANGAQPSRELAERFSRAIIDDINPRDSWRASKAFRQHIAVEMAKRAFIRAVELAGGAI